LRRRTALSFSLALAAPNSLVKLLRKRHKFLGVLDASVILDSNSVVQPGRRAWPSGTRQGLWPRQRDGLAALCLLRTGFGGGRRGGGYLPGWHLCEESWDAALGCLGQISQVGAEMKRLLDHQGSLREWLGDDRTANRFFICFLEPGDSAMLDTYRRDDLG